MSDSLVIAIISDLHCRSKSSDLNSAGTTRLYSDIARKPINHHPVSALIELIEENNIIADYVLCPGDITDKADNQGMMSGWSFLLDIQRAFKSKKLLTTLGNHDVKSRDFKPDDIRLKDPEITTPFDFVKNVDRNYPFDENNINKSYWADHFAIVEDEDSAFFIFNSVYSHINSVTANKCVITQAILSEMENRLKKISSKKYKIAMCHHHPIKHANKTYLDDDVMDKGDLFIDLLNNYGFDILIHGHKHDPRLTVINSFTVLASGSFSALANLADVGADNVFHIIKFSDSSKKGIIESYVYKPQKGWLLNPGSYFPSKTGFGLNIDITDLISKSVTWFNKTKKPFVYYSDFINQFPDFQYLNPKQQEKTQLIMQQEHNLEFVPKLSDGSVKLMKMV